MKRKIALFTLILSFALILFAAGDIYQTMSAPNPGSEAFNTSLRTSSLAIKVVDDQGNEVFDLLQAYKDLDTLEVGKVYEEEVKVKNSGTAAEYVRAIVRRYWTDADGNKVTNVTISRDGENIISGAIEPDKIILNGMSKEWIRNDLESTRETSIYYLDHVLNSGEVSDHLLKGVKIDQDVLNHFVEETETTDSSKISRITYLYDDLKLNIDLEIQSVQANENAIRSVWGSTNLKIDGDRLIVE